MRKRISRQNAPLRIGIITMWYNEEVLAPFFLSHYGYADEIRILLDTDTDDATWDICHNHPIVKIEPFSFKEGFDDFLKQEKINEVVQSLGGEFDWIFVVDADEFIFCLNEEPRSFLARQYGNVVVAKMWQVYRHVTDSDLTCLKSPVFQRRHGDPYLKGFNSYWIKPAVVRPGIRPVWSRGCHKILEAKRGRIKVCRWPFLGAHWANADPGIAVARRLASKRRQSEVNLRHGNQSHNHRVTEEEIRSLCNRHRNDPLLF